MIGRWLVSRARSAGGTPGGAAHPATPVELRVYLPLLWPDGPDGPVDEAAVRALGRDYARAGRVMDELLADLDILCSVVGIGASSRMIESSSVAWSDAFLDAVAAGSTRDLPPAEFRATAPETEVEDVARRLAAFRTTVWGDLAPSGRLLLVTWSSSPTDRLAEELDAVAEEVRRIFPGAVVARQRRRRRVVAAVPESPAVRPGVTALRARCAELVTSATPTVTVVDAPADAEVVQQLLRSTT